MRRGDILLKVSLLAVMLVLCSWAHVWADDIIQFEQGVNLFSYPVESIDSYSSYDLTNDLNATGGVTSIQRFNRDTGQFETSVWDAGTAAGVDFPITGDEGYIAHVSGSSFGYSFTGVRNCSPVTLREGFNVSGFPCPPDNYTSHELLNYLGADFITRLMRYNPLTGNVETSTWESGSPAGTDFSILHGEAYLAEMAQGTIWISSEPPLPPGNVRAYGGNGQVILTWDKPDGPVPGYNIYRSDTQGGSYTRVNYFMETLKTYTDEDVSNGNTYYYVVTAVNEYGMESDDSDEVNAAPAENDPTIIDTDVSSDTTWDLANSPYIVTTSIKVTNGKSLTIEPGVEIRFDGGHIQVEGTLVAIGAVLDPVVFRSNTTNPVTGDWTGIRFIGADSSGSKLENCRIEHAQTGIYAQDSSPEISHCEILGDQDYSGGDNFGINLLRSNAHIHDNTIAHFLNSSRLGRGMYMRESSPLIERNIIADTERAIEIYFGGNPQILDNTIEDYREAGIWCDGEYQETAAPFPVINHNTIRTIYDHRYIYSIRVQRYVWAGTDPARVIDARHNYWGTTSPQEIAASIFQWPDYSTASPFVDWRGFLDSPGGSPVPGHFIPDGQLPEDELDWTAAQGPYIVLGNAFVGSEQTLNIGPGTEVRFIGNRIVVGGYDRWVRASLRVDGKLDAQGAADNMILFTSHEASPVQGDWESIIFNDMADDTSIISHSRIEYAYNGIWSIGASPTISHNEIIGISGDHLREVFTGLRLEWGCASQVTDNIISGFHNTYAPYLYGGRGIHMYNASPIITGNTIDENSWGIQISVNWQSTLAVNPAISGNHIVNNRFRAIEIWGNSDETLNPMPQVNNNSFTTSYTDSDYVHVRTNSYGNAQFAVVDFHRNWWGTNDPEEIASLIYDWNEHVNSPVVDFRNFLDGPDDTPVPGTQIHAGALTGADLNWTAANSPYLILGKSKVASGDTLTIEPGTEVRFAIGSAGLNSLEVEGTLTAVGSSSDPIIFRSNKGDPAGGDWTGIRFIGSDSSGSKLENCRIEHAQTGIYAEDSSPEISYCEILGDKDYSGWDNFGINLLRSNAHIHDNTIANFLNSSRLGRGMYMRESSPLIERNVIAETERAIEMYFGGNPQIFDNTIEDYREAGIWCDGEYQDTAAPFPVINYNTIQTIYDYNYTYNLRVQRYGWDGADPARVIDARHNYWGTTSPQEIAALIYQWPDYSAASPFVDWRGFLDGPDGSAVPGHFIPDGQLPADELDWTAAQGPYIVLGNAFVGSEQTLTIEPGTEVRFLGNRVVVGGQDRWVRAALRVDGKLDAQGTEGNEILFTSHEASPVQGDWESIIFNDIADDTSIIAHSRIEYAYNGIWSTGASPTISHNEIIGIPGDYYHDIFTGLRLEWGCASLVTDNVISGFHNTYAPNIYGGRGILMYNASPVISNNVLDENSYGIVIYLNWQTPVDVDPNITGNSIINSHVNSFYIIGDWDDNRSPQPIINNNNIFSDYPDQNSFYTANYGGASTLVIDAKNNWWGTSVGSEIDNIIHDKSDHGNSPVVDYSTYLGSDTGDFVLYNITVGNDYFSPNGDGEQDTVTITGSATGPVNWTVTIRDSSGTTVRTYVGPLPWQWDGRDNSGTLSPDGDYMIIIEGSDGGSTILTRTLTTRIDTSAIDTLQIHSPANGATTHDSFDIVCTVNDANLVGYTLEIGSGDAPTSWFRAAGMNDSAYGAHPGTDPVFNKPLYHWVSNETETDGIPQPAWWLGYDNGTYTIRLTATDRAGNRSVETAVITLDNLFITEVSRTDSKIDPVNAETAEVQFTLNKPATVSLKIYPEWEGEAGGLIREISQSSSAGSNSMIWDGKDSSGQVVPDEAYVYVLEASGSGRTDKYLPMTGHVDGSGYGVVPATYNIYTNNFWKIEYRMDPGWPAGRVSMEVTPSGEGTFRTMDMEPHDAEEIFTILWDGRRLNGTLVEVPIGVYFPPPVTLRPNYIIVKSTSNEPVISGQAPFVEVKADPYIVNFCYGEFTSLLYNIDRDADVTIKILPPGVTDPASPDAITLVDNEIQSAGDHTVSWDAADIGDPKNILLEDEGVHTFFIEAAASGKTSTWRGVLNLFR